MGLVQPSLEGTVGVGTVKSALTVVGWLLANTVVSKDNRSSVPRMKSFVRETNCFVDIVNLR